MASSGIDYSKWDALEDSGSEDERPTAAGRGGGGGGGTAAAGDAAAKSSASGGAHGGGGGPSAPSSDLVHPTLSSGGAGAAGAGPGGAAGVDDTGDAKGGAVLLARDVVARLRRLPQTKEVWQVVVRPLRVWSAASTGPPEGPDAVPCRPFAVVVVDVYPSGRLLRYTIADPPEVFPAAADVLAHVVETMLDPPAGGAQRRPERVVFESSTLAVEAAASLAAARVGCEQLWATEAVDDVVAALSRKLVEGGAAASSAAGERPGLLKTPGVTPALVRALWARAARFAAARPWDRLLENFAVRFRAVEAGEGEAELRDGFAAAARGRFDGGGDDGDGGWAWASAMGHVLRDGRGADHPKGVALMFTRYDVEQRLLPGLAPRHHPWDQVCGACGRRGSDVKRCQRCFRAYFCGRDCLKQAWPTHKKACRSTPVGRVSRATGEPIYWARFEASLLLEPRATSVPFDDLDAEQALQLPECAVGRPLALQFRDGETERPSAARLEWLRRALSVLTMLVERDVDVGDATQEPIRWTVPGDGHVPGVDVVVMCDPILPADMEQARAQAKAGNGAADGNGDAQ